MAPTGAAERKRLLLVENDGYCRFFLDEVLQSEATEIAEASDIGQACHMLEEDAVDAVIISLDAFNQIELSPVSILRECNDQIPIIVVSHRSDVDFAVEALRAGAFDYLSKPFNNVARVEKALNQALLSRVQARQATKLAAEELESHGLMGESKPLKDLLAVTNQIAPLNVSVLITGESGTGKELVARAIHAKSGRKAASFFAVNCGAIPDGLVESIFFGHEKGAFTGATHATAGFLEKAHEGTLLLDEVGELSPKAQVVLLRFLEDREFVRVGGTRPLASDARIIASTNRNLEHQVARNQFRADLMFRLNVVHLKIPELRERREDILYLAHYFIRRFSLANAVPERKLSPKAARLLEEYQWPGNVRELENLIEGLMALLPAGKQTITDKEILSYSDNIRKAGATHQEDPMHALVDQDYKAALASFEAFYLKTLLAKHDGNVTRSARAAGMHPVTLHRKLRKLGVRR